MVTRVLIIWWPGFCSSGDPSVGRETGLCGMAGILFIILLIQKYPNLRSDYLVTRVLGIWWTECWPGGWTVWHGILSFNVSPYKITKILDVHNNLDSENLVTHVLIIWWPGFCSSSDPSVGREAGLCGTKCYDSANLVTRVLIIWWPGFWLSGDPGSAHLVTRVLAGRLDCVALRGMDRIEGTWRLNGA
jgi:hypothetical protein